ncbi:aldo/keto reductase [Acuticoccus sp. M5D2P5]|uniref:aldo/keto reductase n=1 Tax=Acuticoccus kalidii TaxID=2910977 RepID=UPI001F1B67E9|nr:aldo/keto reductase [Acuticoccus kalidii]MCF3934960.1 aldo/keto reductase [Acuticoccus kalidii]
MQYVRLGRSGLKISRIGLGGFSFGDKAWQPWVLPEDESHPIMARAIECGVNFIDTADMYSNGVSETIIGRIWPDLARREELVIATKAFGVTGPGPNERGLSRKHLFDAIDGSLTRLKTDYVDLYQTHRTDHDTPIEETLEAMHDIVKSGKARYFGMSNVLAYELMRAIAICEKNGWTKPISVQNHYNLAYREEEREMIPLCMLEGVGVTPWSPLARGFLAGKTTRGGVTGSTRAEADPFIQRFFSGDADYDVQDAVRALAAAKGASMAEIAIAWMLSKPYVAAPVMGATKPEQIESAVRALDVSLTAEEIAALEAPYKPHPVLLHL